MKTRHDCMRMVLWTLMFVLLSGCSGNFGDNKWGKGYLPRNEDDGGDFDSMDYEAYQANFMTISVDSIQYQLGDNFSYITLRGSCFNPGFETTGIYYRAYDAQGYDKNAKGYPYLTNASKVSGTNFYQPTTLKCGDNGQWATMLEVATPLLAYLQGGSLEVFMVAWYNNQQLTNPNAGKETIVLEPPFPEDQSSF